MSDEVIGKLIGGQVAKTVQYHFRDIKRIAVSSITYLEHGGEDAAIITHHVSELQTLVNTLEARGFKKESTEPRSHEQVELDYVTSKLENTRRELAEAKEQLAQVQTAIEEAVIAATTQREKQRQKRRDVHQERADREGISREEAKARSMSEMLGARPRVGGRFVKRTTEELKTIAREPDPRD